LNNDGSVLLIAQSSFTTTTAISFTLALYVNTNTGQGGQGGGSEESFVPVLTPLTTLPTLNGEVLEIAVDATSQILTIFTTTAYLYLSTNQGLTWTTPSLSFIPYPPYEVTSFTMSQGNLGQYMNIAATSTLGIYRSKNQGQYFNYTTNGLVSYEWGGWYNLASSFTGQYVVGAMDQGVFLSTDYGESWSFILAYNPINTNIIEAYVAIDPVGNLICMVEGKSNQIALYPIPNVPTPTPTTFKPTVSSVPTLTHYPSFTPSAIPTLLPTPELWTSGWLTEGFYGSHDCSGPELSLSGYRLGACYLNEQGGSYHYECSSDGGKYSSPICLYCSSCVISIVFSKR
jgi:hypothetical protein